MEEEKKEDSTKKVAEVKGGPYRGIGSSTEVEAESSKSVGDEDDYSFSEELALPKELRGLKEKVYEFEEDLESELRDRGFPDLPVVLEPKSGKARIRMPTGAHNKVTKEYVKFFEGAWKGQASAVNSDNNIYIDVEQPGRRIYTREPDLAFWGPAKTTTKTRCGATISTPLDLDHPPERFSCRDQVESVNPDVVIQFSWKNGSSYEQEAIDDMMNRALVKYNPPQSNNSPPRVGYLIKVRTNAKKRTSDNRLILRAIDVFKIPHGSTYNDAINNRNGASYSRYEPGGPEVLVRITPSDLGDTSTPAPPTFEIKVSELFDDLS